MSDARSAAPAGGGAAAAGAPAGGAGGAGGADLGTGEEIQIRGGEPGDPRPSFADAFAKVREEIAGVVGVVEGDEAAAGDGVLPAETAEARETRLGALSPEERAAAEAAESEGALGGGATDEVLVVDLGAMREGEEPIRIQAEDQAMADHIRSLVNRAATRDTSMRIREEAEAIRAQVDEQRYAVQLDPADFLLRSLGELPPAARTADAVHLAKVLLTQPGVLEQVKGWVGALAAHPEALEAETRLVRSDRIERREKVTPLVEQMKFENLNARQVVRAAYRTVDEMVPDAWTPQQRDRLVADVVRDVQDLQRQERVAVTNPARVAGLVKTRLEPFGMAPRGTKPAAGAGAGRPESKTSARTGPSGQQLRATDSARRRAAGPGTGQGSPVATMPKPPAGTKLTGKNNAFDFVRKHMPALRRAPR